MNKFIFYILLLWIPCIAHARPDNLFFGNFKNQVAFNFGTGIDCGFLIPPPARFVPFYINHIQYSQPATFFSLPARQSLNLAQTIGHGKKYGWNWEKYTIPIMFVSQDVILLQSKQLYYATGIGVGFQAQQNSRIGSKLLFQFKITGGYRISDKLTAEIFMQHFSNGNTAPENNSYAFYGIGLAYNF